MIREKKRFFRMMLARAGRKFTPGPPRHLNEARFTTMDRKTCLMVWKTKNEVDITLQDRASSITFPMNLRKHAASFGSCYEEGGMFTMTSSKAPETEFRVGADNGVLYFSLKSEHSNITTGLSAPDAIIMTRLLEFANSRRIATLI